MTGPDQLSAAFAWLDSHRGIGKPGDVHAGVLKAYMDRLGHEWYVMRDRRDHATAALTWALAAYGLAAAQLDVAHAALMRALDREAGRSSSLQVPR